MAEVKGAKPDLVEMICAKLRQEKETLNRFTRPGKIVIHVNPTQPRGAVEVEVVFRI